MLTVRRRYIYEQKRELEELRDKHGEIPENYRKAIEMRMDFVNKYILRRVSNMYINL